MVDPDLFELRRQTASWRQEGAGAAERSRSFLLARLGAVHLRPLWAWIVLVVFPTLAGVLGLKTGDWTLLKLLGLVGVGAV